MTTLASEEELTGGTLYAAGTLASRGPSNMLWLTWEKHARFSPWINYESGDLRGTHEDVRSRFRLFAARARELRASRTDEPDSPEEAAEKEAIARALANQQAAAIADL